MTLPVLKSAAPSPIDLDEDRAERCPSCRGQERSLQILDSPCSFLRGNLPLGPISLWPTQKNLVSLSPIFGQAISGRTYFQGSGEKGCGGGEERRAGGRKGGRKGAQVILAVWPMLGPPHFFNKGQNEAQNLDFFPTRNFGHFCHHLLLSLPEPLELPKCQQLQP